MTKSLEKEFEEAAELSPEEQDAPADAIRAEMRSEKEWSGSLAASENELERMANEALAEHKAGKTAPLDPDRR